MVRSGITRDHIRTKKRWCSRQSKMGEAYGPVSVHELLQIMLYDLPSVLLVHINPSLLNRPGLQPGTVTVVQLKMHGDRAGAVLWVVERVSNLILHDANLTLKQIRQSIEVIRKRRTHEEQCRIVGFPAHCIMKLIDSKTEVFEIIMGIPQRRTRRHSCQNQEKDPRKSEKRPESICIHKMHSLTSIFT